MIIYLDLPSVCWYVWYSFDYYLVLTSFTSCWFTYFKIVHLFITNTNEFFEILHPPLRLFWLLSIKFNKNFYPLPFILIPLVYYALKSTCFQWEWSSIWVSNNWVWFDFSRHVFAQKIYSSNIWKTQILLSSWKRSKIKHW